LPDKQAKLALRIFALYHNELKPLYIRLNYLFNNPIKHGYVTNLTDYPYSSFHLMLQKQGREALIKQFKEYPEYKTLDLE
jgi:putative transposase